MSEETNEAFRKKWRELGFFADFPDKATRCWTIVGSIRGLRRFCALLRSYVADPRNARLSEHEHYGPYKHLEIITWSEPRLDGHGFHGTLDDFRRLADLVERRVADASPRQTFEIDGVFSRSTDYTLRIEIAPDDFDPATRDRYLR